MQTFVNYALSLHKEELVMDSSYGIISADIGKYVRIEAFLDISYFSHHHQDQEIINYKIV